MTIHGSLGGRGFIHSVLGISAAKTEPFLYATTTAPAQTVTIHRITPTGGSITIFWGDGNTTTVAAGVIVAQSHVYAAAATYEIRVSPLTLVTQLDIHDAKLSGFRSAQLAGNAMTYFVCNSLGSTKQNIVTTADMVIWLPTDWLFGVMPAGSYTINTAHMVTWNPTGWYSYVMPPASTTWVIGANDLSGFRATTNFYINSNALNQAQVNAVLWGLYQAAITPRTGVGGTINVAGSNAAPSGIYQPAAACPVSVATPGKEVANELKNDGCGVGFNKWTTVTTS